MASAVAKIAKPQMRNMLKNDLKRDFAVAFILSGAGSLLWQVFVKDARKKKYADFYKTYDAEADFQRMVKADVFKCVGPDGKPREKE